MSWMLCRTCTTSIGVPRGDGCCQEVSAHYQERGAQQRKDRVLGVLLDRAMRLRSANRARLKHDHGLVLQRIEVPRGDARSRTPSRRESRQRG